MGMLVTDTTPLVGDNGQQGMERSIFPEEGIQVANTYAVLVGEDGSDPYLDPGYGR